MTKIDNFNEISAVQSYVCHRVIIIRIIINTRNF